MEKFDLNKPVFCAAIVMAVTCLVHVFAGGPELYDPLRASDLSKVEVSSFSVIWHFVTLQLFVLSIVLFDLSRRWNSAVFAYALVTITGFALLFVGYGLADLGSIWTMPQWIAFGVTAVLMTWGVVRA